jgi:hypothetical protein
MNVFVDKQGRHIPLIFLEEWPVPPEYREELKTNGQQQDGYLIIENKIYESIHEKYFPTPTGHSVMRFHNPGTLLASLIHQLTGKVPSNCVTCSERAKQMNEWGWLGCWRNRDVILCWLAEEAEKLGHKVDGNTVSGLLKAAIKERLGNR